MINAKRVNEIFLSCLFKEEESKLNPVLCEGIMHNVGFHPKRIKSYEEEIYSILLELPKEFMASQGKGYTFLMSRLDKQGHIWTDLHRDMEQLYLLGLGIGKVKCLMPRADWHLFPGKVPYYVVLDK